MREGAIVWLAGAGFLGAVLFAEQPKGKDISQLAARLDLEYSQLMLNQEDYAPEERIRIFDDWLNENAEEIELVRASGMRDSEEERFEENENEPQTPRERKLKRLNEKMDRALSAIADKNLSPLRTQEAVHRWMTKNEKTVSRIHNLHRDVRREQWSRIEPVYIHVPDDASREELEFADTMEELATMELQLKTDARGMDAEEFQKFYHSHAGRFEALHKKQHKQMKRFERLDLETHVENLKRALGVD